MSGAGGFISPLFVYSILKARTNCRVHMRQQEILDALASYPYAIVMERTGAWIDQE